MRKTDVWTMLQKYFAATYLSTDFNSVAEYYEWSTQGSTQGSGQRLVRVTKGAKANCRPQCAKRQAMPSRATAKMVLVISCSKKKKSVCHMVKEREEQTKINIHEHDGYDAGTNIIKERKII